MLSSADSACRSVRCVWMLVAGVYRDFSDFRVVSEIRRDKSKTWYRSFISPDACCIDIIRPLALLRLPPVLLSFQLSGSHVRLALGGASGAYLAQGSTYAPRQTQTTVGGQQTCDEGARPARRASRASVSPRRRSLFGKPIRPGAAYVPWEVPNTDAPS